MTFPERCILSHVLNKIIRLNSKTVLDFGLLPRCKTVLHSFGILSSVEWKFLRDVSDNLSAPSSRVKNPDWPLRMRPKGCLETSVRNYHPSSLKSQNSAVDTKLFTINFICYFHWKVYKLIKVKSLPSS